MKINKFEDLEIWQLSTKIALDVYNLTSNDRFSKDFGLKDQLRRAIISISSNIAEGFEMSNNNDLIKFLRIAKGSAGESRSQLFIALSLKYITNNEYKLIGESLETLSAKIGKFISYLIGKRNNKEFIAFK
jgi:four helix bundle protein